MNSNKFSRYKLPLFYFQETRPDCDFTVFRYYILTCLFLFSFCGIYFRWSYITQDDAFGQTWIARLMKKVKFESKNALQKSKSVKPFNNNNNDEKNIETKLIV
jgi:hypothetical protein